MLFNRKCPLAKGECLLSSGRICQKPDLLLCAEGTLKLITDLKNLILAPTSKKLIENADVKFMCISVFICVCICLTVCMPESLCVNLLSMTHKPL